MTVEQFLNSTDGSDGDLYYLSPQDTDQSKFQTPCKQLLGNNLIDGTVPWAGNLKLHSCNLWMGHSETGSSSGLHVDYHDNFYLLLQGRKRFRIFPPDCAFKMYTYGKIDRIHFNGRISFVGSETKPDGMLLNPRDDDHDDSFEQKDENDDDDDDDESQEGFKFGLNGQDSVGSDSEGFPVTSDGEDDFDLLVGKDDIDQRRPDNFSRINLARLTDAELGEMFPGFLDCAETVINLEAGQTLYLPAGWFHEVTSLSDEAKGRHHVALNYWYHPPDSLASFEQPYSDASAFDVERESTAASNSLAIS